MTARHAVRHTIWVFPLCALIVAAVLALAVGLRNSGPSAAPWSDTELASQLTAQMSATSVTITPGMIGPILAQDCPFLHDPVGLMGATPGGPQAGTAEFAGAEAQVAATLSLLGQSGRCGR